MTTKLVGLALLCLIMSGTAMAQQDKVTSPMSKRSSGESGQGNADLIRRASRPRVEP